MSNPLELLSNAGKDLLRKTYYSKSTANVVIVLGAVGMIVSMFAQLSSIKSNKNLSEDKKKFLLNQETADSITNTALFFGVTTLLSSIVKRKMDTGRILTPEIVKQLEEASEKIGKSFDDIIKDAKTSLKIGNEKYQIGEVVKKSNIFDTVDEMANNNRPKEEIQSYQAEADTFETTKSGLAMIATIFGSVLSTNIISPLVRNKISNHMQEKYNAEHPKTTPYPKQTPTPNIYTRQNTFSSFSSITKI